MGARGGGGRSTRSSTSIISSPTSPGSSGVALRARAPGGQVATPERYRALMRFKLWQQAKEHGLEHHESAEDIARATTKNALEFFGAADDAVL